MSDDKAGAVSPAAAISNLASGSEKGDIVMAEAAAGPSDGPKAPVLGSVTVVVPQGAQQTIHDQHLPIEVDATPRELPVLDQQGAKLVDGGSRGRVTEGRVAVGSRSEVCRVPRSVGKEPAAFCRTQVSYICGLESLGTRNDAMFSRCRDLPPTGGQKVGYAVLSLRTGTTAEPRCSAMATLLPTTV